MASTSSEVPATTTPASVDVRSKDTGSTASPRRAAHTDSEERPSTSRAPASVPVDAAPTQMRGDNNASMARRVASAEAIWSPEQKTNTTSGAGPGPSRSEIWPHTSPTA